MPTHELNSRDMCCMCCVFTSIAHKVAHEISSKIFISPTITPRMLKLFQSSDHEYNSITTRYSQYHYACVVCTLYNDLASAIKYK